MMSSRVTIFFYILLCLQVGIILTVLPWVPHGWLWGAFSDWGNNYFLLLASHKTGYGLQRFISSGWMRGAVTGLGVLNLVMAAWEIINFRESVRALDAEQLSESARKKPTTPVTSDEIRPVTPDPLSDYPRRNR